MIEEKKEKATIIMGEKIYLLPISEKDTEKIIKWRNQPEVKNFFLERNTTTTESHNKWLYDYVYTGRVFQWIIYEILEDCPIGTVYLKDVDYLRVNHFFYVIPKPLIPRRSTLTVA